ncbi:MAG TPA: hypothetical protein VK864_04065, partial [Longimicrobiales bacterium]|nr:hypothetical protein [Longimicrobiales bacterium]
TVNSSNNNPVVRALGFGAGSAGHFETLVANNAPALVTGKRGTGPALRVDYLAGTGDLAVFQVAGVNRARIDNTGAGFFNGGVNGSGADVAEAFEVEGDRATYTPGDVLVISNAHDRRVAKSAEPYSTRVIGVHATKPGLLLTDRDLSANFDDTVPLGVIGVIPTKVTTEGGAIRRGDLLVTSSVPGHAMKGTDRSRMLGAVIGKALQEFDGGGSGVILVLVNVR